MINTLYLIFFTARYNTQTWEQALEFCMAQEEPCLNIEGAPGEGWTAIYYREFWKQIERKTQAIAYVFYSLEHTT